MSGAYCGKNCGECSHKNELSCPGCRKMPPERASTECEIAKCCIGSDFDACDACFLYPSCGKIHDREKVPSKRLQIQAEEKEKEQKLLKSSAFLEKWILRLFWLLLLATAMQFLLFIPAFSAPPVAGDILSFAQSFIYGCILLKISEECKLYKISGILLFAALAINITSIFVQVDTFRENAAIFVGCASFAGELTEFKAHSSVLANIGSQVSYKWDRFFKWYIIANVAFVIITLLWSNILCFLLILLLSAALYIIKLLYLQKTSKAFEIYVYKVEMDDDTF